VDSWRQAFLVPTMPRLFQIRRNKVLAQSFLTLGRSVPAWVCMTCAGSTKVTVFAQILQYTGLKYSGDHFKICT